MTLKGDGMGSRQNISYAQDCGHKTGNMGMQRKLTFVAALISAVAVAHAQDDQAAALPGMMVTGEVFTAKERSSSVSSMVIDEEVVRQSSAQNLSELLIEQGFAIEATPTDHGENTTLIRGFQTEHLMTEANGKLLILIDGRRSGVANTRQISLNNIKYVEVVRGPEMFKYALGSPGGVINIVTRRGGPEQIAGTAYAGYGSYDGYRVGLDLNGQTNNFDYVLGYEHKAMRRDYKDGKGDKVYNTRMSGAERFNFDLGYTFNELHRIGIDGYFYEVDKAHRPSYVDEEGEIRDNNYTDRKTELLHLSYMGSAHDQQLSWQISAGKGKDAYKTYQDNSVYPKGQEVETDRAQGSITYTSSRFDLTGGMDYIKYDVENSSTARGRYLQTGGRDPQWAGIGFPMHPTSRTSLFGAYVVGTLKLMEDKVYLSGGLRYEQARAKDKSVGDEYYADVPYFNGQGITSRDQLPISRKFDHLSPSLGIAWLPVDGFKLRANYTQGWRAPSGRQLFASSFYEDYGAPGDPRLNPERTHAYEIGFDIVQPDWRLSGTYFYYDVKDNIYIYPGVKPDGSGAQGRVVMNMDKRIQEGVELQASMNIAGLLGYQTFEVRPYVSATHMMRKKEVVEDNGPGLRGKWWPITRMPDNIASYGIRYAHMPSQFSANLNFNYYGTQYGGRANVTDGPLVGFGKFNVANLSLSKHFQSVAGSNGIEVKLHVNNLFNKQYSYLGRISDGNYAYPGRNFSTTVSYSF